VPDLNWLFIRAQFFVPLYQKQMLEFIPLSYAPARPAVPRKPER
jgi:hypothetical protein